MTKSKNNIKLRLGKGYHILIDVHEPYKQFSIDKVLPILVVPTFGLAYGLYMLSFLSTFRFLPVPFQIMT